MLAVHWKKFLCLRIQLNILDFKGRGQYNLIHTEKNVIMSFVNSTALNPYYNTVCITRPQVS